jgi:hypothetical protein
VKRHRGCRISGSFGAVEIPLPLLSFYLINEAELRLIASPFGFKVLYGLIRVDDIVRWGVWLGRHIC